MNLVLLLVLQLCMTKGFEKKKNIPVIAQEASVTKQLKCQTFIAI